VSSLTSQILRSSFLLFLTRLIQRSIGLISTLILARALTPDDFGIVAIAALVIHMCEVLSNLGSQQYIIQKDSVTEDDLNSAWTLDLILKTILWGLLVAVIPAISSFYDRPELENALYASSFILIIGALKSPGLILLRKSLQYKPIFTISVCQKVISFCAVMLIVYYSPSYWALVVGNIVSIITLAIGSYFLHPARPKLCIQKIWEQWPFSQWVLLKGGVGFTRAQVDTMLVSKYFSSEELGAYHLSRHISIMPSTEIIAPAIEPLLVSFAKVKNNARELAYRLSLCLLVVSLLIVPASVFIWFFPEPIVDFFLGSQWTNTYPLISALSILLYTIAIGQVLSQCCVALGKVRSLFIYDLLSLIFIFSLLYLFRNESLHEFALFRGVLGLIAVIALFIYISRVSAISISHVINLIAPTFVSALASAYITKWLSFNGFGISIVDLALWLLIFGLIYIFICGFFYLMYCRHIKEWQHLFQILTSFLSKGIKQNNH